MKLIFNFRIQRLLEDKGYPDFGGVILREPLFPDVKKFELLKSPKNIPMLTGCTNLEFDHESIKVPFGKYLEFENPDECDEKYRNDVESGVESRCDSINFFSLFMRISFRSRKSY